MRVIVIGAGVIGCAVAYEIAARGASVVMLDMRRPGAGATAASAGVLAPHIEGHSAALLQLASRSLSMYDAFVERVRADSGCAVEYRRSGTLELALDGTQAACLRETAARYQASGVEHRWLDAPEVLAIEPAVAASATAGLLVPSHGYVGARDLTAALAAGALRRGAALSSGVRADRIASSGDGLAISSAGHTQEADAVVLTAGSWSGDVAIERSLSAPVTPIRGQLLQLGFDGPPVSRVLWGTDCYLVPWQDGTLLAGATMEDVGFDERATVAGVRRLLDAASALLPSAAGARFDAVRVGLRPATSDELPIIGRGAGLPNVVYATGHFRNGVLLAPFTAAAVADLVLDGREAPELALTRPSRFGL